MEEKVKQLEKHLNHVWDLLDVKPTYGEFNKVFPVGDNVQELRDFENENEWLGIARYDTDIEGISIFSLMASITDFLTDGYRLTINTESEEGVPMEGQEVVGFQLLKYKLPKLSISQD